MLQNRSRQQALKWDTSVLGVIDADQYTREVREAMEDQVPNIEFTRKKQHKKHNKKK